MQSKTASTRHPNEKRSRSRATRIFSVLVALTAATTTLSGPASADVPSSSLHNPRGTLGVRTSGHLIRFYGPATDIDSRSGIRVAIYLDGTLRETRHTSNAWYSQTYVRSYGTHHLKVVALNVGLGTNTVIGDRTIKLVNPATRNPRGNAHMARGPHSVYIRGTAYDPDNTKHPLLVREYANGHRVAGTRARGSHHVYVLRGKLRPGINHVTVIAYNIGTGTGNKVIGRRTVRIPGPPSWVNHYQGNQRIAAQLLAKHGWGSGQMSPLVALWNRESGWSVRAANPSGAYGIPQALPGSKMAAAGPNWQSSPTTQIAWGLNYIAGTYGSPSAAWAHSQSNGWY
jgi:hypothetical protein